MFYPLHKTPPDFMLEKRRCGKQKGRPFGLPFPGADKIL
jgi:hypothetical protein